MTIVCVTLFYACSIKNNTIISIFGFLKGNWGPKFPLFIQKLITFFKQKIDFNTDNFHITAARVISKLENLRLRRRHIGISSGLRDISAVLDVMSQRHTLSVHHSVRAIFSKLLLASNTFHLNYKQINLLLIFTNYGFK